MKRAMFGTLFSCGFKKKSEASAEEIQESSTHSFCEQIDENGAEDTDEVEWMTFVNWDMCAGQCL